MDAITRANISRQTAQQQPTLPLSWLLFLCGGWICLGLLFAIWSLLVGIGIIILGLALTGALYVYTTFADQRVEYEDPIPVQHSSARAPSAAFVALGASEPGAKGATVRRPPPIPRSEGSLKPTRAELPQDSFEVFAAGNPKLLIQSQRQYIETLRLKTETDILVLEPVLRARLHKNRKEELEGFLQAQQIVKALAVRVAEIDKAYESDEWDEAILRNFWQLCYGRLELKSDAMSTLHSEGDGPAAVVTVVTCEERLKAIFKLLKRRQTFFRALEDSFRL